MSEIFISYQNSDRDRVRGIVEGLESYGFSVWWDRTIYAGQDFAQVIEEAIDAAKCMIVVWSKNSVRSEWVKAEADEGLKRGMLVPIIIDDEAKIPLVFRRRQTVRLIDWDGSQEHSEFQQLLRSITKLVGSHTRAEIKKDETSAPAAKARPQDSFYNRKSVFVGGAIAGGIPGLVIGYLYYKANQNFGGVGIDRILLSVAFGLTLGAIASMFFYYGMLWFSNRMKSAALSKIFGGAVAGVVCAIPGGLLGALLFVLNTGNPIDPKHVLWGVVWTPGIIVIGFLYPKIKGIDTIILAIFILIVVTLITMAITNGISYALVPYNQRMKEIFEGGSLLVSVGLVIILEAIIGSIAGGLVGAALSLYDLFGSER